MEQALEVVPGLVEAEGGKQARDAAVAIQKRMDVHQLKLGDAAHQHRVDMEVGVQPLDQLRHHHRNFHRCRRGVDHLTGTGVDNIVLDAPILPRRGASATHPVHQFAVDLADHPLGDRVAAVQALGDELEGGAVVEQLPHIVRIGLRYGFTLPEPLNLVQRQPGAFDMGGVVRLQNQRLFAHLAHPICGELRRLQKAPRPLDTGDRGGHVVGDGEFRGEL